MFAPFRARVSSRELALVLAAIFCVIYLPDAGHGFVKDDFQWITTARRPWHTALTEAPDFYRPLVTMSFRANYELFGLDSYPYGVTNLAIAAVCAVLVFALARALGSSIGASIFAATAWAFNFHGINMGILWISGRTALLLTMWALLAALTFLHGKKALCLLCISAALLSKEEAVLLPVVLLLWRVVLNDHLHGGARWAAVTDAWWVLIPVPLYAIARLQTGAMTPFNAPDYYTFTFAPQALARNFLEYCDRSWTFTLTALVFLWCFGRPALTIDSRRFAIAIAGVVWFLCGLAITVFLPLRSNLYACWPSAGAALAGAAIAHGWLERMPVHRVRRVAIAAVLTLAALIPVYHVRNERWVEIADLSRDTMAALDHCTEVDCQAILLEDDPRTRRNFVSTFGEFDTAARLFLGREVSTFLVSTSAEQSPLSKEDCMLRVRLVNDVPDPELTETCATGAP